MRPLSAFDGAEDASEDFNARLGLYGLKKTLSRAVSRRLKEVISCSPQTKKENVKLNPGKGQIVYKADEISSFRDFLEKRGGFVELFEQGTPTEKFPIKEFSDIVALTGYPGNPRTLSACLAVGPFVFKTRVIKTLNLDDPRLRPLPNFNFKFGDSSNEHHRTSQSRTSAVLKKHASLIVRAKTAPAMKRRSDQEVLHHHVHVVLPEAGLNDVQLKRVLAEISKSIKNNLPMTK
jgi:hypothetical protein